jgi:hypothetical protein
MWWSRRAMLQCNLAHHSKLDSPGSDATLANLYSSYIYTFRYGIQACMPYVCLGKCVCCQLYTTCAHLDCPQDLRHDLAHGMQLCTAEQAPADRQTSVQARCVT